ncbi:MAG: response regulator, partial [Myxococcota bacterium]
MAHQLLVVDDSATIQRAIQITFAAEPFQVSTASSGEDAIALAKQMQPAVILIDVKMDGMDGYTVCQGLRGDPATQGSKIILMGSKAEPVDENRARSVGADAQIAKPFETQAVIDQVKRFVGESTTAAPNPIPGVGSAPPAAPSI